MTNGESLPKGQTQETEAKEQPQGRNLSIEEVLNQYPVDREKARDVLLIEISKTLVRISESLRAIPEAILLLSTKIEDERKK